MYHGECYIILNFLSVADHFAPLARYEIQVHLSGQAERI
jgi:hypothetical protein